MRFFYMFILLSTSCLSGAMPDSDKVNQAIEKATMLADHHARLADQFTDDTFLDPIINIEAHRAQQQQAWNQSLLATLPIPLPNASLSVGIYNSDLVHGSLAGLAWTSEWLFYQTVTQTITTTLTTHWMTNASALQAQAQSQQELTDLEKNLIPAKHTTYLTPSVVRTIAMYALCAVALQHMHSDYKLNELPIAGTNKPRPIWSCINPSYGNILTAANPQNWTSTINGWFRTIGLLDPWTDATWLLVSKEITIALAWLRHYVVNTITPNIKTKIAPRAHWLNQAITEQEVLQASIHKQLHTSFIEWVPQKLVYTALGHSMLNVIIATPAWYRLGCYMYQTMTPSSQPTNVGLT